MTELAKFNYAVSNLGMPSKRVSLEVRVHKVDGKLTITIHLDSGGRELIDCSRGIAEVLGDNLRVTIPDWLADKVGIEDLSLVQLDNDDGKFNFVAIEAPPDHTRRN